jgi:hypothetical protein
MTLLSKIYRHRLESLPLVGFGGGGDDTGDDTLKLLSPLEPLALPGFEPLVTIGDTYLAKAFFLLRRFSFSER